MTTDPTPCGRCGQPHTRCRAHNRQGDPCGRYPMKDQEVCRPHGGASPQARAAAERRAARQEAEKLMRSFGSEPTDTDPVEGIHLVICWSRTHMDWLRSRVQELLPDALVWGDSEVTDSDMEGLTVKQKAQVNAWLELYYRERKFFLDACAKAISAGLAEREVRLEEQRGALIADIMRAVLADLELSPDQQAKALVAVPHHLRAAMAAASTN